MKTMIENKTKVMGMMLVILSMLYMPKLSAQAFVYPESPENSEPIAVKYKGNRPTIADFATALLNFSKNEKFYDLVNSEWTRYQQKKPLSKGNTFEVDTKNGYLRFETYNFTEENDTTFMEMCFWNCADGKHKLVCENTVMKINGDYGWDKFVGAQFYLYDNATRKMRMLYADDIGALYDGDGLSVFFLPRKGKDIQVSAAAGGERWNEVLEWDGYKFESATP